MAANVRYRSTFYNTTVSGSGSRTCILEILDQEAVAGVINFESHIPDESFQGLTQDYRPGVYPTTISFDMAIRSSPVTKQGVVYGATSGFLTDILDADEGRFLARLKIDGVIQFVGPIIYDQCSYPDEDIPWFQITAYDGMSRWSTEDYISEVGQIVYYSTKAATSTWDTVPLLFDGPEATDWIVVEHTVKSRFFHGTFVGYDQHTTFARREIYAKTSPGTGWTSVGGGKWVKLLTYTNEIETEEVDVSYSFTRDIDDDHHRTIAEYISRAMALTRMSGEYADPAVMYDTASAWYEHSMAGGVYTADPFTLMRVHEKPLIGGTWQDAMQKICRTYFLRIYYSDGRYHIEQMSRRVNATFTRWIYKADGTSAGSAETADLDINFNTYPISPATGGTFKHLPAFRLVECTIKLDRADLLDGVRWDAGQMGMKYLGSIKRGTGTQVMKVRTVFAVTSTFDPAVLAVLAPNLVNQLCKHNIRVYTQIRLTNVALGTTYYLDPDTDTWSIIPQSYERVVKFGITNYIFSAENYGHTRGDQLFSALSDDIPDPEDAMYDVHMSMSFGVEWDNTNAQNLWEVLNPTKHWHNLATQYQNPNTNTPTNSMRFYSDITTDPWTEDTNTIAQIKTYSKENTVDNSIKVKIESEWGDTNQFEKAIQIYNGTSWVNSKVWSIDGAGDPVEILDLLVTEVMSLRVKPRRLYSGAYITSLPSAQNRIQRGTAYYLPLSCSRDPNFDTYQGDFLEIAASTPPATVIVGTPIAGSPQPGQTTIGDNTTEEDDQDVNDFTLETNEAITASSTLTEVDIVNTAEAFIQAGTSVTIMHPTSGVQEVVVLSQDVNPTSTVMYFNSKTFTFAYPDASFILPQVDDGLFPTSLAQVYYFFKNNYSASEIHAPDFTFMDEEGTSPHVIAKKYNVRRNGIRINWNPAPGTSPQIRKSSYYFDSSEKKWKFWIPLSGETIEIEAAR